MEFEREEENEPEAEAEAPEVDGLQKELGAAKAQAQEYLDGWQRARAEFANYKKRVEKEQAETYQNATARVMARYLDVLDDFDRAMKDQPTEGEGARWAEGISLIYRKLQNILEAEGVTPIEGEGQEFDPGQHEAVTHEDSDEHPAGHVIEVLRKGYKIGDRVIRPALVRVAK
ncbi:MAG: nucleotide exchange factor GrpE [Anaerolineales bacterium]